MSPYERLEERLHAHGVCVETLEPPGRADALYVRIPSASISAIFLSPRLGTSALRLCVLCEEAGHHYTSVGFVDPATYAGRKQESIARAWAIGHLLPPAKFLAAAREGVRNRYELASFLGVTESFLQQSLAHYGKKYPQGFSCGPVTLTFDPLGIAVRGADG